MPGGRDLHHRRCIAVIGTLGDDDPLPTTDKAGHPQGDVVALAAGAGKYHIRQPGGERRQQAVRVLLQYREQIAGVGVQ